MRRPLAGLCTATAIAAAVLVGVFVGQVPANAAAHATVKSSSCYYNGHTIKWTGNTYHEYQCETYKTGNTWVDETKVGILYAGSNWMVCQWNFKAAYPNPRVGSAVNTYWLFTKADKALVSGYEGWGWFPATYVTQGGNNAPVPGVPICGGPGSTTPPVRNTH